MNDNNENTITSNPKSIIYFILSLIGSLLMLYLIVFAISRGWKKGQTNG